MSLIKKQPLLAKKVYKSARPLQRLFKGGRKSFTRIIEDSKFFARIVAASAKQPSKKNLFYKLIVPGSSAVSTLYGLRFFSKPGVETIWHEVTHSLGLGRNHFLTANALGAYAGWLKKPGERISMKALEESTMLTAGILLEKQKKRVENASSRLMLLSNFLTTPEHGKIFWSKKSKVKDSIANRGRFLGLWALVKETELQKPGIGFLIIRDICQGRKFSQVEADIASGKLLQELEERKYPISALLAEARKST